MGEDSPNFNAFQNASFYSIAFFSVSMRYLIFQVHVHYLNGVHCLIFQVELEKYAWKLKKVFLKIPQIQRKTPVLKSVFTKVVGRLTYFGDKLSL